MLTSNLGDILILSEFVTGGAVAISKVFAWVGTGGNVGGGTLQDITPEPGGSPAVFSITNSVAIPAPTCWPYTPNGGVLGGDIPARAFFEGGINLSAPEFGALAGSCFSSFLVETRASPSPSATLKDFVLGNFQECEATCSKVASDDSVCAGTATTYTYTAENPSSPVAITVSLVDDNATPLSSADDIDVIASHNAGTDVLVGGGTPETVTIQPGGSAGPYTRTVTLAVGSYHNKLTVHATSPSNIPDCFASADVEVFARPTANAGDDQTVNCTDAATTAFTLSGTSTNGTGVWSVLSGPVVINSQSQTGDAVSGSVTFTGTGTATLRLTTTGITGTPCPTATDEVVLTVTPNVHVSINSAACDANATTVTLTATISGGTAPALQWSGGSSATSSSITVGPGTYTVTVTDANGCTDTKTRKVGVCTD